MAPPAPGTRMPTPDTRRFRRRIKDLAAAEQTEITRARLVARPHPLRREVELIRELREQIAVRTIRVNAAETALAEFAGEPPPGPGPHAPGWHRPASPEV